MNTIPSGDLWLAVFGYDDAEKVLEAAEQCDRTPQDYIRSSVIEAQSQGLDVDTDTAFADLCGYCGVAAS